MPPLFNRSHQPPKKDRAPPVLVQNASSTGGRDRRVLGLAKTWNGNGNVANSPSIGEFGTVPKIVTSAAPTSAPSHNTLPNGTNTLPGLGSMPNGMYAGPPVYSFLPTNVPLSASGSSETLSISSQNGDDQRQYGFLGGVGKNVVLGVDEVARVLRDVGAELARRALDTPMLFSNQSLELNQTRMRMFIQAFLGTVRTSSRRNVRKPIENFAQDIAFASDQELAWLLRWALARLTRVRDGTREVCHGCLDWETYEEWRGRERAAKYPINAFDRLEHLLPSDVYQFIIKNLFALLSKFAAHSHKSGLTPHALASYFAPLLFDIPTSSSWATGHVAFVRAASATEHLILSYIRSTGRRDGSLGITDLPSRLQEWVTGYPAMVASDADIAHGRPRRAARVVRCEVASRTVRAYSRDLILGAESWADDIPTGWSTWDRVVLKERRGDGRRPKFTNSWRRKMAVKETLPLPESSKRGDKVTYGDSVRPRQETNAQKHDGDAGWYTSIAGQEWSAFEESGFGGSSNSPQDGRPAQENGDIRSRLQFDLNESAKLSVAERRQTMDWTDFTSAGFNRTEPYLAASLTFSAPVQSSITEWPKERDELRRRLVKTEKESTPFMYDTTPRTGPAASVEGADNRGRVYIEEAFVDCWTDLMMGAGWADRDELTFKEASWAIIEYKARPSSQTDEDAPPPTADPRTTALHILFEERVPLDYQMAVADPKRKKSLHNIFKRKKSEKGATSDQRPVASLASQNDFDKMLTKGAQKKLTLSRADHSVTSSLWHAAVEPDGPKRPTPTLPALPANAQAKVNAHASASSKSNARQITSPASKSRKGSLTPSPQSRPDSRNRNNEDSKPKLFKSIRRVKSSGNHKEKTQREVSMDFELKSASGASSGNSSPNEYGNESDEKWMDILISNGAKPMRQDGGAASQASTARPPRVAAKGGRKAVPPGEWANDITPSASRIDNRMANMSMSDTNSSRTLQPPIQIKSRSNSAGSHSDMSHGQDLSSYGRHDSESGFEYDGDYPAEESSLVSSRYADSGAVSGDDVSVNPDDSISVRRRPLTPDDPAATPGGVIGALNNGGGGWSPQRDNSPGYEGLVAPRPRLAGQRDAIFSIVDHYRDSRDPDSQNTTPPGSAQYGGISDEHRDSYIERTYADERTNSAYDSGVGGDSNARDSYIERTFAHERVNSAYSAEESEFNPVPPGPIFDLTPGREPSPARYKHGEPLHFVGEEDEEEE